MGWSFRIARIAGTEVRLHVTFLLLLAWIGFSAYRAAGAAAASAGMVFVLLVFACVLLHEFGHVLAARRYGIPTPDITLLPIGGVARLSRMPEEPRQEFVIALAGPAVNVAIALVLYALLGRSGMADNVLALDAARANVLGRVLTVNVWLVLFNLVPAFPMDGGRILRALLAMRMSYVRATKIAATIGKGLAVLFGLLGMMGSPMLILIALFVFQGATMEAAAAHVRALQRMPASAAMLTEFRTLRAEANLADGLDSLLHGSQHEYPVTDAWGGVVGMVTQEGLVEGMQRFGPGAPIVRVMRNDVPAVSPDTLLPDVVERMREDSCTAVIVTDEAGRMIGLVTSDGIQRLLSGR
ncbi:MAG TPA: site-2 protease family protein [Longimicrobiales bacterium]|nr:site-2 protease family protein [Longimicrobiales bacterium]